jgi:hypothetical protein
LKVASLSAFDVDACGCRARRWGCFAGEQFAGFQVAWQGEPATNDPTAASTLTLSTVHGAGHEVPTYKGQQALQLFRRFLARV